MKRLPIFFALSLLMASPAWAQLTYSPTWNGAYQPLDGATVASPIAVRVKDCPAGPWTFVLDGVTSNVERVCPFDLGGDNFVVALPPGEHVITATGSVTHTARFTVSATPNPPTDPTVTGKARIDWRPPTKCAAGEPLDECPTLGFEIEQARSAEGPWAAIHTASPTSTSYQMTGLVPGLYFWRLYTVTVEDIRSNPTTPVSFTVVADTVPLPKWVVAPITGTRPVYEPVANQASTAMVRGTTQGRIDPGKPCGEEVFKVSRSSYRYVDERDVVLDSPTYQGREHVAICVQP